MSLYFSAFSLVANGFLQFFYLTALWLCGVFFSSFFFHCVCVCVYTYTSGVQSI